MRSSADTSYADIKDDAAKRLAEEARVLRRWLFDAALPLWWSNGADRVNGGFEELLDLEGRAVVAPRRARVQARQIYVYAAAGALGWQGPWQGAAQHGIDYFIAHYFRPDGLVRASVSPEGASVDDGPVLYDQAFSLLAFAMARGDPAGSTDRARALLEAVERRFRLNGPGYGSGDPARPFQSNPHMHLFEAALAWMERDPAPVWKELASRIANLAMNRFVDARTGALREFFDETWAPAAGADGTIVEPGHQFEWAWLLYRWGQMTETPAALSIAHRLFAIGVNNGLDPTRGVAINALDDSLAPLDPSARLWPQTERVKAALLAAECAPAEREHHLCQAIDGIGGLRRYLLPNGTWRDKLSVDDVFVEEPAPASSLYHIVGAIAEVLRATG